MKRTAKSLTAAVLTLSMSCTPVCISAQTVGLSAMTAYADGETVYEELTYESIRYAVGDEGIIITGYTEDIPAELVIPDEIDGEPVREIGMTAFANAPLTKITLPDSLFTIADDAFDGCEGLTICGNEYSYIEDYARRLGFSFEALPKLTYNGMTYVVQQKTVTITGYTDELPAVLEIPAEIDGMPVTDFSQMAFYNCSILKEVTIPETVESFGMQTFLSCKNLETVHLPQGLKGIYEAAFGSCTSLKSIDLPDGLILLGNLVFSGCTALEEINIPASVTEFGEPAFGETPWLAARRAEGPLVIVNGILIDGQTASGDVVIPDGVRNIAAYAFSWEASTAVTSVTSVTIPDSVTIIGLAAFNGCEKLETVNLPDHAIHIGSGAFSDTPWFAAKEAENPLVIAAGDVLTGKGTTGAVEIPDGVQFISPWAFEANESITEVTLPASVTEIGRSAFGSCKALETLTVLNPNCEFLGGAQTVSSGFDARWSPIFNGTIVGYDGSTAEKYAKEYGYQFRSLGAYQPPAGDLNHDNACTVADAVLLTHIIAEDSALSPDAALCGLADLNGDDAIDLLDLRTLLKMINA